MKKLFKKIWVSKIGKIFFSYLLLFIWVMFCKYMPLVIPNPKIEITVDLFLLVIAFWGIFKIMSSHYGEEPLV
jgi:hypothetical protein